MLVDDKPAQVVDGQLLLNPGPHELIADADGYEREARRVRAKSGERGQLRFALGVPGAAPVAANGELPAGPQPLEAQTATSSRKPMWVSYALLGTGGALLVTSLVTGLMSNGALGELDDKCGPKHLCPGDYDWQATRDRGQGLALASDVLLFSGLAVAGTGAVLWLLWHDDDREAPRVALACDGRGCMGQMRGSF